MKKVSKGFFLGSVAAGGMIGIILIGVGIDLESTWLSGLGKLVMLYGGIVWLVLWYKAWSSIQDGYARTTPGKAIGLLFIPFFNIYWVFQAIWGFAKDFNKYTERHSIVARRLPEGLFLAYVIVVLANATLLLLFLAIVPGYIISPNYS